MDPNLFRGGRKTPQVCIDLKKYDQNGFKKFVLEQFLKTPARPARQAKKQRDQRSKKRCIDHFERTGRDHTSSKGYSIREKYFPYRSCTHVPRNRPPKVAFLQEIVIFWCTKVGFATSFDANNRQRLALVYCYYRINVKNWIRAPISRILRHSLTSQFAGCRWSRSLPLVATSVTPARPAKERAQPAKTSARPAPISPPFDGLEGRGVILLTVSNKLGCKPTDANEIPVWNTKVFQILNIFKWDFGLFLVRPSANIS